MLTINNTLDGYLKDVEILGNTIQDEEDLADIRSVGDKVEGQELYEIPVLSRGKNLNNGFELGDLSTSDGTLITSSTKIRSIDFIKIDISNSYNINRNGVNEGFNVYCYNDKKEFLGLKTKSNGLFVSSDFLEGTKYVKFVKTSTDTINLQLEEGTQATPYEPYQEDKITILSPVQLEKVGDVADRIIEKDGVWGVEKNVKNILLDGSYVTNYIANSISFGNSGVACGGGFKIHDMSPQNNVVTDTFINDRFRAVSSITEWNDSLATIPCITGNSLPGVSIKTTIQATGGDTVEHFKSWMQSNPTMIKYQTTNPQFIPLPHDQQVKLRTFANKTNISFLTEIEGTIKAQVPKSLGATVNTHTEQINDLNKELDRVKKLEESTVSTVETESDFTTVEATSNGYFEDVKLEGKTLVNRILPSFTYSGDRYSLDNTTNKLNLTNKLYTFVNHHYSNGIIVIGTLSTLTYKRQINSTNNITKITLDDDEYIRYIQFAQGESSDALLKIKQTLLLEGDHTQNPPSYFEGLKSVGQGTDEIVVSSVGSKDNLINLKTVNQDWGMGWFETNINPNNLNYHSCETFDVSFLRNKRIYAGCFRDEVIFTKYVDFACIFDENKQQIGDRFGITVDGYVVPSNAKYMRLMCFSGGNNTLTYIDRDKYCVRLTPFKDGEQFVEHQSDKKRLLFYNTETQTWEKPVLREWDSIEKHSDGKYYYHQRSGEVVLNGSEGWSGFSTANGVGKAFTFVLKDKAYGFDNLVCDKLPVTHTFASEVSILNGISGTPNNNALWVSINASITDIEGFKQWLQANNVTVVYQLAEEKVYECTNIDLITYANETNYIVESGAIVPKSTLKVHNNISNVVSLLQKKVSILESNITNYMITQNRMQLASTYSADSVTFKVDYALCSEEVEYNEDLYNLILHNILVGKDNYDYDKMFTMILDYASWNQISWEQFDILVGLMDMQHNPPVEETPTDDETVEEIPNEIM